MKRFARPSTLFCSVLALLLIVGSGPTLRAGPIINIGIPVLIIVDENGNGTIQFDGTPALPLPSALAPDPGPGGLSSALTYDLGNPPSLTAGDVFLTDLLGTSDVIRFNPSGTGGNLSASLVFYSLAGGSELADTGFPSAFYPNTLNLTENELLGTFYTPLLGQPGFVGNGFDVTYEFISGPAPVNGVPEVGSTALLLGVTLLGLAGFKRIAGWC
jgi:hypothetical protein